MRIMQISVFLENRTGQLSEITQLLARNQIDIRAISIAETSSYGLARMIVSDTPKAQEVLLQHGDMLSVTPVWAVEVPDEPGGLAQLLQLLAQHHIDIEYMYSLFTHQAGKAYMVLRIPNETDFLRILEEKGLHLLDMQALGLR